MRGVTDGVNWFPNNGQRVSLLLFYTELFLKKNNGFILLCEGHYRAGERLVVFLMSKECSEILKWTWKGWGVKYVLTFNASGNVSAVYDVE